MLSQTKKIKWVEAFGIISGDKISGIINDNEEFAIYHRGDGKYVLIIKIDSHPRKHYPIPNKTLLGAKRQANKELKEHVQYLRNSLNSLVNTI
jgi:hypothetical protein